MIRIGLISDTHGYFDDKLYRHFKDVDEIWHAGDIGSMEVVQKISAFKPLVAVHGNIDSMIIYKQFPVHQKFTIEEVSVWMTHIGGYPNNYDRKIRLELTQKPPKLFISGHSHILKVMFDKKLGLLHINPGAAGKNGLHKVRTAVRFEIDGAIIQNMDVIELGLRAQK
jgi:uncharacterized protein